MKGVVIGISNLKVKTTKFGKMTFRYVKIHDVDGKEFLFRIKDEVIDDLATDPSGRVTPLKSGQEVEVTHFDMDKKDKDKPYVWNFPDGTPMYFNPKRITVLKHRELNSIQKYNLEEINFYDNFVQMKNDKGVLKLSAEDWLHLTGIQSSIHLNKVKNQLKPNAKKEAYVEIQAIFKIYYNWNIEKTWLYHNDDTNVILVTENLQPIRKVVQEEEEIKRTRLLLEEIKLRLQNKMFLNYDDIVVLARKYTMPERDINEYIRNAVWGKNYDENFTTYLQKKSDNVYFGKEGLFYEIGPITVLETPETGKATYVFIGNSNWIASKIQAMREENSESYNYDKDDPSANHNGSTAWRELLYRMKKAEPETFNWFVGRVIHFDEKQWKQDVDTVLDQAKIDAPEVIKTYPEDPKERTSVATDYVQPRENEKFAVEFYICQTCGHYPIRIHRNLSTGKVIDGEAKCPNCGEKRATKITWNKAYQANEFGQITE